MIGYLPRRPSFSCRAATDQRSPPKGGVSARRVGDTTLSVPTVPEYLKSAPMYSDATVAQVRATVSEMLLTIDRDREAAVRRYSRDLDGWDPPSFLVDEQTIADAESAVDASLKEPIAFAQDQVRR